MVLRRQVCYIFDVLFCQMSFGVRVQNVKIQDIEQFSCVAAVGRKSIS